MELNEREEVPRMRAMRLVQGGVGEEEPPAPVSLACQPYMRIIKRSMRIVQRHKRIGRIAIADVAAMVRRIGLASVPGSRVRLGTMLSAMAARMT